MDILLLRGFNNYFNRIVKKYSTLTEYQSHSTSYVSFTGINFDPNDGIATELILGSPTQQESSASLAWDQLGTPDYLICSETVNNVTTIKFRWFVLESERTRDGQYRLALKRDVIAEHFDDIMKAPCFVEKGIIRDPNNPLLVNTEGSIVNQIKKSEAPIVDDTNSAWLVGYIKKNYPGKDSSGIMPEDLDNVYDYAALDFKDCISFADGSQPATKTLINNLSSNCLNIFYMIRANGFPTNPYYDYRGALVWNQWFKITYQGSQGNPGYGNLNDHLIYANNSNGGPTTDWAGYMEQATGSEVIPVETKAAFINFLKSNLKSSNNLFEVDQISSGSTLNDLRAKYNGAIISKGGKYYQLSFSTGGSTWISGTYNAGSNASIGSYMAYVVNSLSSNVSGTTFTFNSDTRGNSLEASLNYAPVNIIASEVGSVDNSITIHIPSSESRITCKDAQYDIFAVPFIPRQYRSDYQGGFIYNSTNYTVDSESSLFIVQKLMTDLGISTPAGQSGNFAYDLQLLPYCPIKVPISNNKVNLDQLNTGSYTIITKHVVTPGGEGGSNVEEDVPIGYVLFPSSANFTVDIAVNKSINKGGNSEALAVKLSNECDFLRLTAPNFNSTYEFKLSKMLDNKITLVNVDCTYRPINPYIKLNPDFSGLYGMDFDDSTGLLFNGDFSLATLSDAWINYEHNNKNYQAMFNRQIQSLDITQQLGREQMTFQNIVGAITGTIGGATGGALGGAKMGGAPGAIAGGVVGFAGGAALGIAGGVKNNEWLARQQGEAKSYTIDMYNYQLGNIKALPQSLTKGDPITYNNKVWPILEEFSCTDAEKEVIKNKIRYDGMTIMAVGSLEDYSKSTDFSDVYVKGQLIRLTNVHDDSHLIDTIYQEVNKGFYIPQ